MKLWRILMATTATATAITMMIMIAMAGGFFPGAPVRAEGTVVPPAAATAAIKIAVINVSDLYEKTQYSQNFRAEGKARLDRFNENYRKEEDALLKIKGEIEKLNPDGKAYGEKAAEYSVRRAVQDTVRKFQQQEVGRWHLDNMLEIFDKAEKVIRKLSEEKGYDLVVRVASGESSQADKEERFMANKVNHVLYANPRFDITSEVIERMDRDFLRDTGSSAPGVAPAPASGATGTKAPAVEGK